MGNEIVLSVTLSVNANETEAFREAVVRLVAAVKADAPGMLLYKFYVDDDGTTARAIHVYADSEALEAHNAVNDGPIAAVLEHATLVKVEVLGDTTRDVLESGRGTREGGASHESAAMHDVAGFVRFP